MSAKYKCDGCGEKMSEHRNEFTAYEFVDDGIRVRFTVDFNQWIENDICDVCGLAAIKKAAKQLKK